MTYRHGKIVKLLLLLLLLLVLFELDNEVMDVTTLIFVNIRYMKVIKDYFPHLPDWSLLLVCFA